MYRAFTNDTRFGYKVQIIIGLVAIIISVFVFLFSISNNNVYNQKYSSYIPVTAKVINSVKTSDNTTIYTIEYKIDGKIYTAGNFNINVLDTNDSVKIRYNKNNPSEIIWEQDSTYRSAITTSGLFIVLGSIYLIFGIKRLNNESIIK